MDGDEIAVEWDEATPVENIPLEEKQEVRSMTKAEVIGFFRHCSRSLFFIHSYFQIKNSDRVLFAINSTG